MDRNTCEFALRVLRQVDFGTVKTALNAEVRIGKASYDINADGGMTVKIEIMPIVNGVAKGKEVLAFERECFLYGLEKSDLGKTFITPEGTYEIVGLNTRAHKMPILAKKFNDGRRYKFSAIFVKRALGR